MPRKTTVIMDDREKDPWDENYLGPEFKVTKKRLTVGDYTIDGMEDIVRIEKKSNWSEIAVNIGRKEYRESFIKELRSLSDFPVRAVVMHEELSMLPRPHVRLPKNKKLALFNWYVNITFEYGVPFLTLPPKAQSQHVIRNMLKKIHEYNRNGRLHYH